MLSMQWIHTHLCVHINAWISVRMLPHQFLFVTPTCAASHASPSIHNTDNTKDAYSWGNFGFSKSDRVFLWQTITGGQSLFSSHKTRTVLCFNTMHTQRCQVQKKIIREIFMTRCLFSPGPRSYRDISFNMLSIFCVRIIGLCIP